MTERHVFAIPDHAEMYSRHNVPFEYAFHRDMIVADKVRENTWHLPIWLLKNVSAQFGIQHNPLGKMLERIDAGQFLGEYGHPIDRSPAEVSVIREEYLSHRLTKAKLIDISDGMKVLICTVTAEGPMRQQLIDAMSSLDKSRNSTFNIGLGLRSIGVKHNVQDFIVHEVCALDLVGLDPQFTGRIDPDDYDAIRQGLDSLQE